MHRKVFAVLILFFTTLFFIFPEDDDWYYDVPITSIEFEGLHSVKKSELNGFVSSYINQPFSEDLYVDLLNRLFALDYFDDISAYAKESPKKDGTVLLVIKVDEKPIINSISFSGNRKIRNGELREQINIKSSDIFVESQVLLDERAIRNHYLEKGYTNSSVTHTFKETPDGNIDIVFNINEGASTIIREIHFSGNSVFSERTLKNKISSKEAGLFRDGAYQYSTLEQDKLKIIAHYREHGYADATILDVKIDTEMNEQKQRKELIITFIIQEGVQYTYAGVELKGNSVFTTEELKNPLKLKVGSVYNETKFQQDLSAIVSIYYENGYMTNDFEPVARKDAERQEISYVLNIGERPRSHVENIIIKGNTKTKENVIRREIPIESGDVFSRNKVMTGLRSLMNLQYFSNVIPEPQQGSEADLVDLVFTVEEQPTSTFQFGMTFSGATEPNSIPISLFLKLENSNLFGEGRTISTSTSISNTEQMLDFTYSQNWIGNMPIFFSGSIAVSHTKDNMLVNYIDPNFNFNNTSYFSQYHGWSIDLSSALGRRWMFDYATVSLNGGLSTALKRNDYDQSKYVPVDLGVSAFANRWGVSNSLFANLSIDNRDLSFDPSKGWFASERLTWNGLIPQLEKEFYLRSDTKLEGYLKLLDIPFGDVWALKLVLAGYSNLSMLFPINGQMGENNQLFVDGMFHGRGWSFSSAPSRGNFMLANNLELRMPIIPGILGLDFFFDSVAIMPKIEDVSRMSLNDFYFSYGPGIRFLMPQFPLHLLFAWKFKVTDGVAQFDKNPFQFVLSFNITNR